LLLVLVSLGIGLLSATASRTELRIAHNEVLDQRALAVAEAGVMHAKKLIANATFDEALAANATGVCAAVTGYGVGARQGPV
jgi:Tfp pilus assembly protein PilX